MNGHEDQGLLSTPPGSLRTVRPCAACSRVPEAGGRCEECGAMWAPDERGTLQMVSLIAAREVKSALWLLLGGGLDDAGKEKWLSMRLAEGMSEEQIFADALRYIDGQVAT